MHGKRKIKFILILVVLVIAAVYYYIELPAINLHELGLWKFLIVVFLVGAVVCIFFGPDKGKFQPGMRFKEFIRSAKLTSLSVAAALTLALICLVGSILSSPIINARRYQKLITPETRDFSEDVKEISYDEIPLLDRDSAALLGNREMGTMVEYVSQFEVSTGYTQINYHGVPTRVSPLVYGNIFKWLTNRSKGIPAYIRINMASQDVECVKLSEGMRYSDNEHFSRNIYRHLRFHYPTYLFEDVHFEIDEDGVPYWVCPVKSYSIGLFGGEVIKAVVLCNAVTGELSEYPIDQVPTWIDRAYPADLLISYYDYYGTLKHGYWNTLFSARDCLRTTDGYNYIALNDDVWVYTGVTSVGSDESNVGFVLMNQRTSETRYYEIPGAEEYSAMASAQGQVQHLGYVATFPLLLNIANEPTYFISLKDAAGLVKKYAMVNIGRYSIVAIGDSVAECEKSYISLMRQNQINISTDPTTDLSLTDTIHQIVPVVTEGSTKFYLVLDHNPDIFQADPVSVLDIVRFREGDAVTITYQEGEEFNIISSITKQ